MNRQHLLAIGIVAMAFALIVAACGDGIDTGENAELNVISTEIALGDMGPDHRTRPLEESLVLENQGRGDLEVQNIEWIDKPSRLVAYHTGPVSEADADVECESDADCSEGGICMTQANNCRDRGFRPLPHEVRTDATFSQPLALESSDTEVVCPEAPDGAPPNYCGEIRVETNAANDGGNANIYIVAGETSGVLSLPDTYLEFTLAAPSVTQVKEFVIENTGSSDLEMERMNFDRNEHWFEVTPAMSNTVIEGGNSQTFTIEMTPPDGTLEEDLDFQTGITFESSSSTAQGMTIRVTAGIGDAPRIEVDPMQLSFEDGNEQTLTIYNYGSAGLPLNSMELRPQGAIDDYYTVTYEGTNVLENSNAIPNLAQAESEDEPAYEEFTVTFTAPTGDESAVGDLRINHQDSLADNRTTVTLLGDAAEVAVGEIGPTPITFRSDGDGAQSRQLAVSNQGNADLEITGVELDEMNAQTDADDYDVDGLEGMVIGPDEVGEATLTYTGANEFEQHLRVLPESNHAGQSQLMQLDVSTANLSPATMELDLVTSFPSGVASVDELTSFSIVDEAEVGRTDLTTWVLHEKPAGSLAVLDGSGEQATIIPDVAGTYRISALVRDDDNREVQEVLEFTAE